MYRRRAWSYLSICVVAEFLIAYGAPLPGVILFSAMLFGLLADATYAWNTSHYALFLVLMLVPLTRMVSMVLPLEAREPIYWYVFISVPLFIATGLIRNTLQRGGWLSSLIPGKRLYQFLVAIVGMCAGILLYLLDPRPPIIEQPSWEQTLIAAMILLICTGVLEEMIFRGTIQPIVVDKLGRSGIIYVALLYTVLHPGTHSLVTTGLVFLTALFWSWVVMKTHSLLGVILSHGLLNILVYLLLPLLWAMPSQGM